MKKLLCTTAALAALTLSIPAQAGSFDGPYLGLQLGHNNTKVDSQYTNILGTGVSTGSDYGASGLELGLIGGYRVKQDRFVYGLEVDGTLSNAKGTLFDYNNGAGDNVKVEVEKRHSYAIGPRVGYLVTDSSLAFIGVDWTRGSFKSTLSGDATGTDSESLNGVRFGAGLEVAATKEISVRLDYQHTSWKTSSDSDGAGGTFSLDPTEDTARIGAIYSF